ncbi:MAG: 50S ribosomal protein L9 [Tepidisphaeraceae bacterium]|jgi:large subunit ribosomal protein L9
MASVKLLLTESVKNLGKVGDLVDVSAGYARNYLLPQHFAVEPTPGNIKKIEARRQEILRIEAEKRKEHAEIIEALAGVEVTLERKANEQGHLFGSVSATDISKAIQAQGHRVQADDVLLPGRLDHIDSYVVKVKFAEDLVTDIKVWVAPDAESKALMEAARKAAREAEKEQQARDEKEAAAEAAEGHSEVAAKKKH